jgi:hypothetical protein
MNLHYLGKTADNTFQAFDNFLGGSTLYSIKFSGLTPNALYDHAAMSLKTAVTGNVTMGFYDSSGNLLEGSSIIPMNAVQSPSATLASPVPVPADGIIIVGFLYDTTVDAWQASASNRLSSHTTATGMTLPTTASLTFNQEPIIMIVSSSSSALIASPQMKTSAENCGSTTFSNYPASIFSQENTTINLWTKLNTITKQLQDNGDRSPYCTSDLGNSVNGVCVVIKGNNAINYQRNSFDSTFFAVNIENSVTPTGVYPNDTNWHMITIVHQWNTAASSSFTAYYLDGTLQYNATGQSLSTPKTPAQNANQGVFYIG